MAFKMSGRRARMIEEGKLQLAGCKWESMLTEAGVRERMLASHPNLVQFLDLVVAKMKPYEGKGWTVFCDWIYDASRKHSPELVEGFMRHPPHHISDIVFKLK